MPRSLYKVNEIFYSLQGEGVRAGTAAIFVRFAGCNLMCLQNSVGFTCDTNHVPFSEMTAEQIVAACRRHGPGPGWIVLTGGEPALQVDRHLIDVLHAPGYRLAIETNGTIKLPRGIDWVTVSPKTPPDTICQLEADELKLVKGDHPLVAVGKIVASYHVVSPAFYSNGKVNLSAAKWCIRFVEEHSEWRLSLQLHKILGIK